MGVDIMAIDLSNQFKGADSFHKTEPINPIAKVDKAAKVAKVEVTDSVSGQPINASRLLTTSKLSNESDLSAKNLDKIENAQKDKKPDGTTGMSASKDINKIINRNTIAEFGFYESTNKIIIKIKDKNTNEIIKEIPSEKALELLEKALEFAGLLVDEKR